MVHLTLNSVPSTDKSHGRARRHAAAAGGWQPDEDPGEVRRPGEGGPVADADRPAEAGGDGGGAAGGRAAAEGVYDYNQADLARQEQLYKDGIISKQAYDQAVQAFQNSKAALESAGGADQDPARTACVLPDPRAVCGHRGRYSGASGRLRVVDDDADHGGREQRTWRPTSTSRPSAPRRCKPGWRWICWTRAERCWRTRTSTSSRPRWTTDCRGFWRRRRFRSRRSGCATGQIVNARITWSTFADGDDSGAGGDAHRRAELCVCGRGADSGYHRSPGPGDAGRADRQCVSRAGGVEDRAIA
jgi:hypothetical protein